MEAHCHGASCSSQSPQTTASMAGSASTTGSGVLRSNGAGNAMLFDEVTSAAVVQAANTRRQHRMASRRVAFMEAQG